MRSTRAAFPSLLTIANNGDSARCRKIPRSFLLKYNLIPIMITFEYTVRHHQLSIVNFETEEFRLVSETLY